MARPLSAYFGTIGENPGYGLSRPCSVVFIMLLISRASNRRDLLVRERPDLAPADYEDADGDAFPDQCDPNQVSDTGRNRSFREREW